MSQLDRLIDAMVQHAAEALVLAAGQQPALSKAGAQRPIVKNVLDAEQVTRLLAEVAPAAEREALALGQTADFVYLQGDRSVRIEVAPGPQAVIRVVPDAPPAPLGAGPAILRLLHTLVERRGSDLHLSSGSRPLLRIDGDLVEMADHPPVDPATARRMLLEIAPERNREEFEQSGDTDFAYEIAGLCRFRCNLFMDRKGPGGVFRVIPAQIRSADDLGLPQALRDLCSLTKGLVLVTGPTGSGKSTTLASLVDLVNASRRDHVITIEDPIEFVHPNKQCLVNQREVHVHTRGFKNALRAALREDPDVVLVGEMRDLETIAIALETAETGHLVFGTLHTSSAVSTVDRIVDQFPADQQQQIRVLLSESLKAVVAQVLCKRIGGGREPAFEILIVNAAVSNLIREGKTFQIPSIMQTGRKFGMTPMNDSLFELVQAKRITPQEAYLRAIEKDALLSMLRAKISPSISVD
jgi:twitching motility protein PilT